jgi:Domain of unknown function (DUF3597)
MGMFSDLMNKIFGHAAPGAEPPQVTGSPQAGVGAGVSAAAPQAAKSVDVAAILDQMASANAQKLDWKHSIVDLMKLVGMDSSLKARRELAADLHYSGDTADTAAMNIWLHKEVMTKLAQNGGKVPQDLLTR